MKLEDVGVDMSVENAMRELERLKAVHIVVGKDDKIEVHKKLSGLDSETRTLVEILAWLMTINFRTLRCSRGLYSAKDTI